MSENSFANLAQLNFGEKLAELVMDKLRDKNIPHYSYNKSNRRWSWITEEQPFLGHRFSSERKLIVQRPLEEEFFPNGMSKIDLLAYTKKNCCAIEVKLGKAIGAQSFPFSFLDKWKGDDDFLIRNRKIKFNGNMIHLLDSNRQFNGDDSKFDFYSVDMENNKLPLDLDWWMLIRKDSLRNTVVEDGAFVQKNITKKYSSEFKKSFNQLVKVFVFEELWMLLDAHDMNEIIAKTISPILIEFKKLPNTCLNDKDVINGIESELSRLNKS